MSTGSGEPYVETASHFTVHVDDERLAVVRAEATLFQGGEVRSHDTDYFTLIRDEAGDRKFVNGSNTTMRADSPRPARVAVEVDDGEGRGFSPLDKRPPKPYP